MTAQSHEPHATPAAFAWMEFGHLRRVWPMEFRIHEEAREEWDRLRERWGEAEARRWLRALVAWLESHAGVPPEAAADTRAGSTIYWVLFGEVGVEYIVRDAPPEPRGWWDLPRRLARWRRGRQRRVIFTGFDLPAYPATSTPLPR